MKKVQKLSKSYAINHESSLNKFKDKSRPISGNWINIKKIHNKTYLSEIKHPWKNIKRLDADFVKHQKIYEEILEILTFSLNKTLNIKKTKRYWRIALGGWLHYFILILFEKLIVIKNVSLFNKNIHLIKRGYSNKDLTPYDIEEFNFLKKSPYFHDFFLLKVSEFINIKKKNNLILTSKPIRPIYRKYNENLLTIIKKKIIIFSNKINQFLNLKSKVIFFDTYFKKKNIFFLRLKHIYFYRFIRTIHDSKNFYDKILREDLKNNTNFFLKNKKVKEKDVINFYLENITKFIPVIYLEKYADTVKEINKIFSIKKVKTIFSLNFIYKSFKAIFIAEATENNAKLILGQHGGNYGQSKHLFAEKHELKIADKYITWGWKKNNKKIKAIGILREISDFKRNIGFDNNTKDKLLMVLRNRNSLLSEFDSAKNSYFFSNYAYVTCPTFISKLNKDIRYKNLLVRPNHEEHGWNFRSILSSQFDSIKIDNGNNKISDLINNSRLVIATYISTTHLETLAANVPTIIFANLESYNLNYKTLQLLKILKKANIFFDNEKKAALFVNKNWKNINDWWDSRSTQNARKKYVFNFARNNNKFKNIKNLLDINE